MPKKKIKPFRKKEPRRILKKNHFEEFYQQMLKIAPLVLEILKKNAKARDYDNLLYVLVWKAQGMKESDTCKKFKYRLIIGKYASPETIGRARRKIQESEKHKDLRGTMYKQRKLAENKVRNQLSLW